MAVHIDLIGFIWRVGEYGTPEFRERVMVPPTFKHTILKRTTKFIYSGLPRDQIRVFFFFNRGLDESEEATDTLLLQN